jgi:Flp pilus assembly protein TadG
MPTAKPIRFFRRWRRGAALVEMAVILPLLITIVLACIDFGRFGSAYIAITNAARAGAGVGSNSKVTTITLATWRTKIRVAVTSEFTGQTGVNVNRLTVPDPELIVEPSGLRRVRVRANYQFQMIVPWPLLPNQVTMGRTVEMRMIN